MYFKKAATINTYVHCLLMECLFQEDSTLIDMKLYVWFLCLKRLNSDLLLSNITASVNPSVQRDRIFNHQIYHCENKS